MRKTGSRKFIFKFRLLWAVIGSLAVIPSFIHHSQRFISAQSSDPLTVTTNFTGRKLGPSDTVELSTDRPLRNDEGRLVMFIDTTDVTSLFAAESGLRRLTPGIYRLPVGESTLRVYLVGSETQWRLIGEFPLSVERSPDVKIEPGSTSVANAGQPENGSSPDADSLKVGFTPTTSINVKGQNQTRTFPLESAPDPNPFTDLDGQSSLELKVSRRNWAISNKFDFVGVSARRNAIRFGELQNEAPLIDLSSYLVELTAKRFKMNLGHISFGSNRHLINSFSSRGVSATVPVGPGNELSFAAMNGTSIVGYDNFLGATRRNHSVIGAGFAREFVKERPNGFRLEFSVTRGSLLPLTNLNQGAVNDAETSFGFGFRLLGSDKKQRLRWEGGVTRSRFTNPQDPLLDQGQSVVAVKETWRTARYAEVSFDVIQGMNLWKEKKLKVTGTYRHEEIEPLFRSIAAQTQPDKAKNQFEVSASFGEMNLVFGNLRERDNLADIPSILRTLNRRNSVNFALPLNSFFTPAKPKKWLPAVSYTFEHVHQFGAAIPTNGDFDDPSQIPNQHNFVHGFNAQWSVSEKVSFGYRVSHAFADNRQPGRELADLRSGVQGMTMGLKVSRDFDLDIEVSREFQTNLEVARTDETIRIGPKVVWRTPFLKNSVFSANLSATAAGDTGNLNDSRNAEFDIQWAYRFTLGKEKFKKLDTQFFIRYANRYGSTFERLFLNNAFNKTESFNFGLSFNIL